VQRVAVLEGGAHVARVVAQFRLLHLDDVGAEVGQDRGRIRSRENLSDLNDLDAVEHSAPKKRLVNHSTIFGTF
jgi:hypothetical protein